MIDRAWFRWLSTAAALASIVAAVPEVSIAAETSYYQGSVWSISLYQPEEGEEDRPASPFCNISALAGAGKSISLQYVLRSPDVTDLMIRLNKAGWNLPAGQTTNVTLRDRDGGTVLPFRVISDETLMNDGLSAAGISSQIKMETVVLMVFNTRRAPSSLLVEFGGNEAPWLVPEVGRHEAYEVRQVFEVCIRDLKKNGAKVFGSSTNDENTSPF